MLPPKQNVLRFVATLPDDVSYDKILYHVDVMRAIEIGTAQAERGEGTEHDAFFDELLADDAKNKNYLDAPGKTRSARNSPVHRKKRATHRNGVRSKAAISSRAAKKVP
jgi:hypothetical protein